MANNIAEHVIISIENDKDRIRKRPTIYIPSTGVAGAVHIIFEIIDNSIDELTANNAVGNSIEVYFDTSTKVCKVVDDGGGIPHDGMLKAFTVINSSGKFENGNNSHFGMSGGINGVGSKLSNFLSEWCNVTSNFKGKSLTYKFKDGELDKKSEGTTKSHGTSVEFRLDKRFVDIEHVDVEEIRERYEEKSYLFPKLKLKLTVTNNGKVVKEYKYGNKTIEDRVSSMKPDTPIIRVTDKREETVLVQITDDTLTKKDVGIDIAFAMKEAVLDTDDQMKYIIAYGNTIKNYLGGTHVDGLKLGIQKFFQKNVMPKLKGKDKDLNIMPSDMTAGLCGFVVAKVYEPEFRGQYKDMLSNQEVKFAVRDAVYDHLCDLKPNEVNPMIDFVKRVTRGRMASKKVRKKDVSNAFSKDRLEDFKDIVQNVNSIDPECILCEGKSAASNAFSARDPYNQAIFSIKRPKNIFDLPSSHIDKVKSVFNDLLDICGIEAGKKCEPEKSTMNRILMLTDGDIDGADIAVTTICLLAKHCKPLIDAGMVGRILPPAYSIPVGNGKKKYVRSQREFFDTIVKAFIKNEKVYRKGKLLSKSDLRKFIETNFEYDQRLEKLAKRQCCDPNIIEYIAWCYHGDYKSQKKSYWMNKLKKYTGLKIISESGGLVIDGDIPGLDYINLCLDSDFDRHVNKFKEYQSKNDDIFNYGLNDEKDTSKTVYDIMKLMRSYIPKGVERFKGLGELTPDEMHDLCMNKDTRTVIIFKFDDFEKDMEKINIIMSTKKEYLEARKDIMMQITADDMDIDT